MATFFNPSIDAGYLHSSVREHPEAALVTERVEADVIRWATRGSSSTRTVILDGYDETTPADSESDLKMALKETIGEVVSWRLRHYDDDRNVVSESRGARSKSWAQGVDPDWPDGWNRRLIDFLFPARASY